MKSFKVVIDREALNQEPCIYVNTAVLFGDERMNIDDRALLFELIGKCAIYSKINMAEIKTNSGMGQVRFYRSIKKLIKFGYLKKKRGHSSCSWSVHESLYYTTDPEKITGSAYEMKNGKQG